MCEAKALIRAVKKFPCIWNIHHGDYHNKDTKDSAWEQVYEEVIKDWNTFSKADKETRGADLKKKWTHIRDYYRRGLKKNKKNPTGSSTKKIKKYMYADLLYFLAPVFNKRLAKSNYPTDIENSETEEEPHFEQEETSPFVSLAISPLARSVKREREDVPTQTHRILQKNQSEVSQKQQDVEDDDTKFLLSFRTHMKHMTECEKIDFKLGMLQLVKKTITN